MPEELAQTLATRARRTGPLPSEVTPRPTASGGGISAARGVADALRKREEAAQRALAESLENLVETLTPRAQTDPAAEAIERLIKSLEVRAGTAPKVRPAVPPAREAALEALPRPHVPGAARAPRGLPPGKALPAPFGPTAQEIADLAELKRMAYSKLHEAMVNEIRPSAMRAWEAAGRPQGKLEEFVRAEAAARGYDYDRIMAELDKPLEEHARDIEELVRLGSTAGVVPEVRSVEDVYRILSSVVEGRPSSGAAAAAAEVAPAIEVAPGYSGRAPEVEELIRRILRSGGGKVLARGVEVGPPEMPIARPKVIIPAAERVPKEPPKVAAVTRLPKRAKRSGGDRKGR
jgi:predicted ArsR family transcriptional regulator